MLRVKKAYLATTLTFVTLAASACADASTRASNIDVAGGSEQTVGSEEIPFDWRNPFPAGEKLAVNDLYSKLGLNVVFTPLVPSDLAPQVVQQSPKTFPLESRQIAMSFESLELGSVVLFEYPADRAAVANEFEALARMRAGCVTTSPDPAFGSEPGVDCSFGGGSYTSLQDGTKALYFEGRGTLALFLTAPMSPEERSGLAGTTLMDPIIEVEIQSPKLLATEDKLVSFANSLMPILTNT